MIRIAISISVVLTIITLLDIPLKSISMINRSLNSLFKTSLLCTNSLRFKHKPKYCNTIKDLNEKSAGFNDDNVTHYTAISFFHFIKIKEVEIPTVINETKSRLLERNIKGTLLISEEGFNGQFVVPSDQLDEFKMVLKQASPQIFNNIDINVGQSFDRTEIKYEFPFKKLIVKRKNEVLTDGIEPLDWDDAGDELTPKQWHERLNHIMTTNYTSTTPTLSNHLDSPQQLQSVDSIPLLIDCRNKYESEMGHFQGAISLDTLRFSETWEALDKLLENVPQDREILTYCTGGIRCVKVNAYLKQKMGFKNIGRLKKGIVAYDSWIQHNNSSLSGDEQGETSTTNSLFIGNNFLFDRRRIIVDKESDGP